MYIEDKKVISMEAMLYEKLDHKLVKCCLCNHRCVIKPNHRGICGVRENKDGILYALNYGISVASSIDPIEKKPLYEYMANTRTYSFATVGCNMDCKWCQNYTISQSPKPNEDIFFIGFFFTEGWLPAQSENVRIKPSCTLLLVSLLFGKSCRNQKKKNKHGENKNLFRNHSPLAVRFILVNH